MQFTSANSGKLNRSNWEEVTNGKNYFEKSENEDQQEESKTNESKAHKSPKIESDNGYDPIESEPRRKRRRSSSWKIPSFISNLLIVIVLALLTWFIIYSAGKVKSNSKINSSDLSEESLKEIEDNPFENDLERMIYEALQSNNYKLAIRLQFIYVVRLLSEKGLISWKKHKTNAAYGRELKGHTFSPKYSYLNSLFEHVWYGELEYSSGDLMEINNSFIDSVSQLKKLNNS